MTEPERLKQTGIVRLGRKNRFRYATATGATVSRTELARIEALRIPPAWKEVAINSASGGMLQAVGKDTAGRWQYIYHARQVRKRERTKFARLLKFGKAIPKLRNEVSRNLRRSDLRRERVMACIIRILSTCFLRAGSQVYADENGSYGLATLRRKHVRVRADLVEFDFPGKSRGNQRRQLKDRPVARVVRELLKHGGAWVFKYQDGDGRFIDVRRRDINDYIKEVMGERFTSKDFRTWAGTLICASALARAGVDAGDTGGSKKRKINEGDQGNCRHFRQHSGRMPLGLHLPRGHKKLRARQGRGRILRDPQRPGKIPRASLSQSRAHPSPHAREVEQS